MKITGKFLILILAVLLFTAANSNAQVFLKAPIVGKDNVMKPKKTNNHEIWVPEDWVCPDGKKYLYRPGFWAFPPTPKSVYIPGHWEKTAKGYYRVPGYWKNPHL
jgi:hypothetical protein